MVDELPLKSFNVQALIDNVAELRIIIQRVRQKEGVGSDEDELAFHRAITDIDLLLDIIGGIKTAYESLAKDYTQALERIAQLESVRDAHEQMIRTRDETIKSQGAKKVTERKKPRTKGKGRQ